MNFDNFEMDSNSVVFSAIFAFCGVFQTMESEKIYYKSEF